jgi:hypothetical protein
MSAVPKQSSLGRLLALGLKGCRCNRQAEAARRGQDFAESAGGRGPLASPEG